MIISHNQRSAECKRDFKPGDVVRWKVDAATAPLTSEVVEVGNLTLVVKSKGMKMRIFKSMVVWWSDENGNTE